MTQPHSYKLTLKGGWAWFSANHLMDRLRKRHVPHVDTVEQQFATLLDCAAGCPLLAEQLEPLLLNIAGRLDNAVAAAKQGDRPRSFFCLFNLMVFLEKAIALSRKEDS